MNNISEFGKIIKKYPGMRMVKKKDQISLYANAWTLTVDCFKIFISFIKNKLL